MQIGVSLPCCTHSCCFSTAKCGCEDSLWAACKSPRNTWNILNTYRLTLLYIACYRIETTTRVKTDGQWDWHSCCKMLVCISKEADLEIEVVWDWNGAWKRLNTDLSNLWSAVPNIFVANFCTKVRRDKAQAAREKELLAVPWHSEWIRQYSKLLTPKWMIGIALKLNFEPCAIRHEGKWRNMGDDETNVHWSIQINPSKWSNGAEAHEFCCIGGARAIRQSSCHLGKQRAWVGGASARIAFWKLAFLYIFVIFHHNGFNGYMLVFPFGHLNPSDKFAGACSYSWPFGHFIEEWDRIGGWILGSQAPWQARCARHSDWMKDPKLQNVASHFFHNSRYDKLLSLFDKLQKKYDELQGAHLEETDQC